MSSDIRIRELEPGSGARIELVVGAITAGGFYAHLTGDGYILAEGVGLSRRKAIDACIRDLPRRYRNRARRLAVVTVGEARKGEAVTAVSRRRASEEQIDLFA